MVESARHTIKVAAVWVPLVTGTILFLVGIGVCNTPAQQTQAAIKAQLDQKREFDAQIKLLSDQAEKREDLNREAHKDILTRVDAQQEKIYDMQVLILRELRGYSSAPSGPTFQRGVPVK